MSAACRIPDAKRNPCVICQAGYGAWYAARIAKLNLRRQKSIHKQRLDLITVQTLTAWVKIIVLACISEIHGQGENRYHSITHLSTVAVNMLLIYKDGLDYFSALLLPLVLHLLFFLILSLPPWN